MPSSLRRTALVAACVAASLGACARPAAGPGTSAPTPVSSESPPALAREFRGVWIATVANIDWPTAAARGDSARQKAELRTLLDRAAADGFNAVIFQVRSGADATYASTLEPWATLLGGPQGTDPGYDPLAYAIDQAHARGLELHAWFNPYRVGNVRDSLSVAPSHVFRTRRGLVRLYGGQLWLDPGDPATADYTLGVVRDVVRRYDVDGIHIDDYFYPYPVADSTGRLLDFPDSATFAADNPRGLARGDWRRENVNRFVERLASEVHREKPWVKVGISPFGIWRPGNPPGVTGLDAYDAIYADSRRWLGSGWADYFVPQLYWGIEPAAQSFTALLDWWTAPAQNPRRRPVWPGLASYRVDTTAYAPGTLPPIADTATFRFRPDEMLRQVRETRRRASAGADGEVFYNGSSVLTRVGGALGALLRDSVYATPALVPAMPWLGDRAPDAPRLGAVDSAAVPGAGWAVHVAPPSGEPVRWWVVTARVDGRWQAPRRVPGSAVIVGLGDGRTRPERLVVWAVSRTGVASAAARWAR